MPSERFAEPDEIAGIIAFLCSDTAVMIIWTQPAGKQRIYDAVTRLFLSQRHSVISKCI